MKVYPHSEFIEGLYNVMTLRRLAEGEARAILNARMFESIVEGWLPELREVVTEMEKEGVEFENAQLLISEAVNMARAVGLSLLREKVSTTHVTPAISDAIDRILKRVKPA